MPNWTNEQKQAIDEKGQNILVAAAAGSGKTTVLVERMINKIINQKIDIDKILVVTFTNAAASEMREKILEAIYKKLEENPDDENLQKQITLLNISNISTIDAFCLQVIKNNFYELENISPNFRIADNTEVEILKEEILEEIFEEKYEKEDEDFSDLINTYTEYRDDAPLKELVKKIYKYIKSNPFPFKWLDDKIEIFNLKKQKLLDEDFSKTIWGKELMEDVKKKITIHIELLEKVANELITDIDLESYYKLIENDLNNIKILNQNFDSWDKAYEISKNISFPKWSGSRKKSKIKDEAKKIRDIVKDEILEIQDKIFIDESCIINNDLYYMYNILKKLENLIIEFDEKFTNKKREKNMIDFSDIEHLALKILVKEDENGNIVKSKIAEKYSEKFEEIAIDEYQDSNEVQEYILSSISKGNNIFMVGDVKQSIYKFRQAMPELFMKKYKQYKKINDKPEDGIKIQLFKNFRSRKNVLDFTNVIFENIMSEKLGDVEYTKEEYLNLGAIDYKENNQNLKTQIKILDLEQEINYETKDDGDNEEDDDVNNENEHLENIEVEAKYIAKEIENLIKNKFQVYDRKKEEFRNIRPKDIVILLRSTKNKAQIYEQELIREKIPVFSDSSEQYLDTIEIETIMNLLKIIDNPIQDIPLVTVLKSPIGGFTENELVEIRLSDKKDNFYECMQKAKINVEPELRKKIEDFLLKLDMWRKEQEYLALDELIWKIYLDTRYYNYVGLMPNGIQRQANLKILFERAKQYESASFKGLYNFINFIERLKLSSGDLGAAKIIGENDDVVRIMSIHKSKGLEFPVVFLANTNKQFNKQDIRRDSILLHQKYGLGIRYLDYEKLIKYDTVVRNIIKDKIDIENISEEMRIFYVALTRAKEKIYITSVENKVEKKIENMQKKVEIYKKENEKIDSNILRKCLSYLDWIIYIYLYNKEKISEIADFEIINKEKLNEIIKENEEEDKIKIEDILGKIKDDNKKDDNEILKNIKEKLEFEYKYQEETLLPTKISVSEIKNAKVEKEITLLKPKFIENQKENKLTGAQKGTLMHLCLQKLDINEEYTIEKIEKFIEELKQKNIINEQEKLSIRKDRIYQFTKSNIWKELKTAKKIEREKPFYISIPAKEIYQKDIEGDVLVQGIIDLYYINQNDELILLDYKTDYVEKEEELIEKYRNQLLIYKRALEKSLKRKVDRTCIYSLYLQKTYDII